MSDPFDYEPVPLKIVGTAKVKYRMLTEQERRTYSCRKCGEVKCRCAPSMPAPAWFSKTGAPIMADESEPFVPPLQPSIPADHLEPTAGQIAESVITRTEYLSRQNTALRKAAIRLMKRDNVNNMVIGALEMDHADPQSLTIRLDNNGNAHLQLES